MATDTASVAAPTQPYANERFGYALDVPAGFEPQPAPQNDDGRIFRFSGGDATLTVFGYNDALEAGLDGLAEHAREGIDSLSYEARPDGGVVTSGTAGEDVVYARGVLRDIVGVVARLRYPTGQNQGRSWAEVIDASLRWTE